MLDYLNDSVKHNNIYTSHEHVKPDLLITQQQKVILEWIIFCVLCQPIDIVGIVTNVINIMCFAKQGFKDPVNVSLLGIQCTRADVSAVYVDPIMLICPPQLIARRLAISDLGCLVTLIWTNLCLTPAFRASDLPFDALEFQYLTSAWPHATFTRVTSWITALITIERCLCIASPLKVKEIVTSKRVSVVICSVYVILIASVAPVYVINRLDWKFFLTETEPSLDLFTQKIEKMLKV